MLRIRDIESFYGNSQALFGVNFEMEAGEVATLLGRNGMGKTTTVRTIMGLLPAAAGTIEFEGKPVHHLPSYAIARLGFGLVPEGRQVFPTLTVRENLVATAANHSGSDDPYDMERVLSIFPKLGERMGHYGNQLSGGEQQMLAIARALMTNPKVLILDEATEGLAPLVREEIWQGLEILKQRGESILVIDKNLDALLKIADRHHIMEKGQVVWSGSSSELAGDDSLTSRYLGV
ncbi:MAG: ABC transporter ATP-binding protein [Candidatus Sedimenticola sp. 20ELBAFRAG]